MTKGYEFKISVGSTKTESFYNSPSISNLKKENTDISGRQKHLETIQVLEDWLTRYEWIATADIGRGRLLVPDTFKVLGHHLWRLALAGPVGDELVKAIREVERLDERMLVRMSFADDARDLQLLSWEFLRYPETSADRGFFLGAEGNLVLARFVDGPSDSAIRTADDALRMLFITALPATEEFAGESQELETLKEALRTIPALEIKDEPTWNATSIIDRLAEFKRSGHEVDVVHLVGVCKDRNGQPMLYLPDGQGGDRLINPEPVVRTLTRDPRNRPALVVLHLSESEKESSEHFEQLGPSFIRAGIPAVLAMQYPMPPEKGRDFVKNFYEMLALGERVGAAVQTARATLSLTGGDLNRQFGTPVLYMQNSEDGALFRAHESSEDQEAPIPGPLAARSAKGPASDEVPMDITRDLLRTLDTLRPQTPVVEELRLWVDQNLWQEDLDVVLRSLKALRRENYNSAEYRQLCDYLVDSIRSRTLVSKS
jgi:hypothetical protein